MALKKPLLACAIKRQASPEGNASFLSKITFGWITGLISKGSRHTLSPDDVYDLPTQYKSQAVVTKFHQNLQTSSDALTSPKTTQREPEFQSLLTGDFRSDLRRRKFAKSAAQKQDQYQQDFSAPRPKDRLSGGSRRLDAKTQKTITLLTTLIKTFWRELLFAFLTRLLADSVRFANPLLLDGLMDYLDTKREHPPLRGYMLVAGFFLVNLVFAASQNHAFHLSNITGMKAKTALVSSVYAKTLKMTSEVRRHYTIGTIVNLISSDCARIQTVTPQLWNIPTAPVQICLALYLLGRRLGVSVLVGVAILLILLVLSARVSVRSWRFKAEQVVHKDRRLKTLSEILFGIKMIKLSAWEEPFERRVAEIRERELRCMKSAAILDTITVCCLSCLPTLITTGTLLAYTLILDTQSLSASKVFVSISLINTLKYPMSILPNSISGLVEAQISLTRLADFLSCEELSPAEMGCNTEDGVSIDVESAAFSWDRNRKPTLHGINLKIREGQLVGVVGSVGAGKSSLLCSLMREMHSPHGSFSVKGSVAYVPQEAWIQNRSLKNCILFDEPLDPKRYKRVIDICALKPDIAMLPKGDATQVGDKGATLSGGQKLRVGLARSVYQDADVYLLDDPLSGLDPHVAKHVFHQVIGNKGLLRDKTRVLVTSGFQWLPLCDVIIVMEQGRISQTGTYRELMGSDGPFSRLLKMSQIQTMDSAGEQDGNSANVHQLSADGKSCDLDMKPVSNVPQDLKKRNKQSGKGNLCNMGQGKGIQNGAVKQSCLFAFLRVFGTIPSLVTVVSLLLRKCVNVGSSLWLTAWTGDQFLRDPSRVGSAAWNQRMALYIGVYCVLGLLEVVFTSVFVGEIKINMVSVSRHLHSSMLNTVMHQPMEFFDTIPAGHILNRFSRDVGEMGRPTATVIRMLGHQLVSVVSVLIVISYTTPAFLPAAATFIGLYCFLQRWYTRCSTQLSRYRSMSRSPVLSHVTETVSGVMTIRAFRAEKKFQAQLERLVDENNVFVYIVMSALRWFRLHLQLLGGLVVVLAALFVILTPGISSASAGLSLTYAMQVTAALTTLVYYISQSESSMISLERVMEYINMPREQGARVSVSPPRQWPKQGAVNFSHFSTRYRPDLDLALTSIHCTLHSGEKVGVVGRTGAGKSTLAMSLFRLMDAAQGSITIDGVNIASVGLRELRSRITILPQEPVLFSGTLRFNLDPNGQHSDSELWTALAKVHLASLVGQLPGRLNFDVDEGGRNISAGQRQLVCMARALLRHTRVLVLDEATAAVDVETDTLIQATLRDTFRDCTVIVIAHRLHTVLHCDRVLVLESGRVVEMDSPAALLDNADSLFYKMARQARYI